MSVIALEEYESFEETLFKQVLIGQSLRHNISLKMLIGSYSEAYLVHDLNLNRIIGNTSDALKIVSDELDKRLINKHFLSVSSNQNYYELVNKITKSGLFLLVSINKSHEQELLNLGFKEISNEDLMNSFVYEFTSDIIYIRPDRMVRLVDIAIYKKVFMSFDKFSFSNCVKKLLKEVSNETVKKEINDESFFKKFYGFSDSIKLCCCEIPLELLIIRSSSRHGYGCVLGDISYNYALMLYLDNIQIKKNPEIKYKLIDGKKRLISFVMSDGDNVSFMASKIPRMLESKRNNYPVTWTLSNLSPISYFNNIINHFYEHDTFITAGSGYGYFYPDINKELTKYIKNETIVNVLEGSLLSLTQKNDYNIDSKYVLVFNILNYALNRKSYTKNGTIILTCNHQLGFEHEINNFINRVNTENSQEPLIVAVNINSVNIERLNDIVSKISEKTEIVSLHQLLSEMRFL